MSGFKTDPEKLRMTASQLQNGVNEMERLSSELRGITESLGADWQGLAADKHKGDFEDWARGEVTIRDALLSISDGLIKKATNYEEAERANLL